MSCSHVVVAEVERGDFGNRGKDGDWTERNEALLALQRLFDEAARLEPPDDREAEPAFDADAFSRLLADGRGKASKPRSKGRAKENKPPRHS